MNGEQIAQKIKRICQQKNIPVKKLLHECSLSKGLIYDLEKRNISPSCDKIMVIADYLNVSVDYLLGKASGGIMIQSQSSTSHITQCGIEDDLDILGRITLLLGSREQQELTEYLNLKKSAFTDWKSGKSSSYRKYLIEIAEFFNVSLDYLVYGKKPCLDDDCFSDLEAELISKFRCLNDVEKGKIIERMDIMLENSMENRKENLK